jgi:acyl-CoA synthetase (NDP forming)
LAELPEPPELVVITIRSDAFAGAIDDSLKSGARAIVVITAGLGETGGEGLKIQEAAVERVRAAGAILVGPNCLGLADLTTDLDLTWGEFGRGELAFVSQSGNIGLELTQLAKQSSLGFSRFISLGNQADLDAADSLEDLIDHPGTKVIAVYIEDFEDGRHFASIAERASRAGKPVILLTVGATDASQRMAQSHTGALVSDSLAVDAACRAAGIYRVDTPMQMLDLAQLLLMPHPLPGPRMSVLGDGGGHVALASDRLVGHGLKVDRFSEALAGRLAAALPPTATTSNPVDVAGGGEEDIWSFERSSRMMAESGEADAVLLTGYFGGYSEDESPWAEEELKVAAAMSAAAEEHRRPLIVQTMYPRSPTSLKFRELRVPVYADIEAPARGLGLIVRRRANPALGVPALPTSSVPSLSGTSYFEVREFLADAGIPFAHAERATSIEEAIAAAGRIGYPIVLKALGTEHKSDRGGVRLAIADDDALRREFLEMQSRLSPNLYSVERQAAIELGVELLIGVKRDRSFGPIALVGLGGMHAEIFRDVAVALAPVSAEQAHGLIRSLRGAELLLGWRGRPRLDLDGAASALRALTELASREATIAEIEVNPLLVLQDDVIGLDARMTQDLR